MTELHPDNCIRVFPRRTSATPADELAFVGEVPLIRPPEMPVRISCAFTWDKPKALALHQVWLPHYSDVRVGGPAFGDPGNSFTPGLFLRRGKVITSRGCDSACPWCVVPDREGPLQEFAVTEGWDICDNNLLACTRPHVESVFGMLSDQKRAARFSGGLEATRIDQHVMELLQSVRIECLWTAYDSAGQEWDVKRAIRRLRRAGLRHRQVGCYVLIGYGNDTTAAAEQRLQKAFEWGAVPFAMLYCDEDGRRAGRAWQMLQRQFARPAAIFATMGSANA